jgi:hypothetical protein
MLHEDEPADWKEHPDFIECPEVAMQENRGAERGTRQV